jgi:eukaryotic-like serine/threonine-protein kinase
MNGRSNLDNGPGFGTLVFVSALVSAVVSVCTVYAALRWGGLNGVLAIAAPAGEQQPEARVPDVVGMRAEAADELLSARKLRLVVRERRADPAVAAGSVIEQNPLAQSRVSSGGEVAVVVSTGPAQRTVPSIVGQALEAGQKALEEAGLKVGTLTEGDSGEPNTITAVVPAAGAVVEPGSSVALTVARPKVSVPKLLNKRMSLAREAIEKAGLEVGDVSEIYNSRRRGNVVLTQDPEGGAKVAPGTKVNLVINQGD